MTGKGISARDPWSVPAPVCGICGVIGGEPDEALLKRMTDAIAHRGPDTDGFYTRPGIGLGYRRLRIVDLVTGDQPISNEDGTIWVVYNGEIYNYPELRPLLEREGHTFRTNADTEVLVHGYEAWGLGLLDRLNGMFAFALWDQKARRLFLARDRLGIKPLYYRRTATGLEFASEIKALLAAPGAPRRPNPRALLEYLTFQNVYGEHTFFEGISRLMPGCLLVAANGRVETRTYWDLRVDGGASTQDAAAAEYRRLLDDSVRLELMSDVPIGAHLSGGIDSSSVVLSAARHLQGFPTFSGRFAGGEFDETAYAETVSRIAKTEHHVIDVNPDMLPPVFDRLVYHLDEPKVGPGALPQFFVASLAAKHVRVVLTGHGGDELFAGYPPYLNAYLADTAKSGGGSEAVRASENLVGRLRSEGVKRTLLLPAYSLAQRDLGRYGRAPFFSDREALDLLAEPVAKAARGHDPRAILEETLERCPSKSSLNRLLYLDVKTYLPALLEVEDRMSMAVSLEARVPILDHRIAEFAASLPAALKVSGMTLKHLPRLALSPVLPKEVLDHRKTGFPVPLADWFRGELRPWVERRLSPEAVAAAGILDPGRVRAEVHAQGRGKGSAERLWMLLNVQSWAETFLGDHVRVPQAR